MTKIFSPWRTVAATFFLSATLLGPVAQASVTIDLYQSGSDVVAIGSGSILLPTGTPLFGFGSAAVIGSLATIILGTPGNDDQYNGILSGPSSFGTGGPETASFSSGDYFGLPGNSPNLIVPVGYVSGSFLSGTDTWTGATLSSLGLIDGTYLYTVSGTLDTITVNIGTAVPEPSSWASLLMGCAGLWAWRRRRSPASAGKGES